MFFFEVQSLRSRAFSVFKVHGLGCRVEVGFRDGDLRMYCSVQRFGGADLACPCPENLHNQNDQSRAAFSHSPCVRIPNPQPEILNPKSYARIAQP